MADYDGFDPGDFPEYWFYGEIGPLRPTQYGQEQMGKRLMRRVDEKLDRLSDAPSGKDEADE